LKDSILLFGTDVNDIYCNKIFKIERYKVIESCKKDITHINWLAVDFDVAEQSVKILQNRIVKAKLAGRIRMVKKLQSLLFKSLNARILAVKRVSENKGKKTAGVDGKLLDTSI
jgi:RNA-directed DNA polymerase